MAKKSKGQLVVVEDRFNYAPLAPNVAAQVQHAAEHIRQAVQRTMEGIVTIGIELLAVKEAIPHGRFGEWLRTEFGWTERTARNFMAVAERFGKTEIISEMKIDPTAAYLLAAPRHRTKQGRRPWNVPRLGSTLRPRSLGNSSRRLGAGPPRSVNKPGLRHSARDSFTR